MEALSFGRAALEHFEVFRFAVVCCGLLGHFEMRLDDVPHVGERNGGALLAVCVRRPPRGRRSVSRSIAVRAFDAGIFDPTSLRRIVWKRIGRST